MPTALSELYSECYLSGACSPRSLNDNAPTGGVQLRSRPLSEYNSERACESSGLHCVLAQKQHIQQASFLGVIGC